MIEITVPVLNEDQTLEGQIRKIISFIDDNLSDVGPIALVIADNGSTDNTELIGRRLASELNNVRYLRLEERGVGRALKASWSSSSADIVGYMDLDLSTQLQHLRPALEILITQKAEIVTGSRLAKGAQVVARTFTRNLTSRAFNLILKLYFNIHFSDGMCGFKFLNRNMLDKLVSAGANSNGWFFATELLIAAEYSGIRVADLPVVWIDDPNSKVRIIKLSIEYLRSMKALKGRLPPKAVAK